jgi:hypothetical protein
MGRPAATTPTSPQMNTPHVDAEKGNGDKPVHKHIEHPSSPTQTTSSGEPLLVRFGSDDQSDPHQWPTWKRYWCVAFASWLNVLVCIGASGYSTGAEGIGKSFNVSEEIVTLGLSLYVVSDDISVRRFDA